jgi:hypothetical protein
MHSFKTIGSFNFCQTISQGAESWTSPVMVIAMGILRTDQPLNATLGLCVVKFSKHSGADDALTFRRLEAIKHPAGVWRDTLLIGCPAAI